MVVALAPVVGVLVVWSAGLVVAADVEAFTAIVAFAAGVAPANVCVVSARLVVVCLPDTVVSCRRASKLFFVMKLPSVVAMGIGRPDVGDIDLPPL